MHVTEIPYKHSLLTFCDKMLQKPGNRSRMKRSLPILLLCLFAFLPSFAQDFGDFPTIGKEQLLNDLELLYQGLDKFHSGMYWYTPKDSVEMAFEKVRAEINRELTVLEFHKLIAPLVALSREDHTNIFLPESVTEKMRSESKFLPLTMVFLGEKLYCVKDGSGIQDAALEGAQIESINGETPSHIVGKLGSLFASDGYIRTVKFSDLRGFAFSRYYFLYYGQIDRFELKLKGIDEPVSIRSQTVETIRQNMNSGADVAGNNDAGDVLEFNILNESVAYLGIHTFDNEEIRTSSKEKKLEVFLRNSFQSIRENNIQTLVVDVSKNTGGSEGNEGLLYSYFGENYQKYKKVRANTQKAVLDNGTDKPVTLKAFGFFERHLFNKKMKDGSLERRESIGKGLMAYKKKPEYPFSGDTYVLISPLTYSGGSEFSNMMYSQDLATFVGQETGGGYYGNTSGYGRSLVLPNSKINVSIPALQFIMNVDPKLPFGSGVIPHHEVIPTFDEYINGENAALSYVLKLVENN